jgi:Flp pilus assembly protein TadG
MQTRPHQSEEGSTMLEFAFSAVVFFILLFGTISVMMAFYIYEVVNQYARDANRYAIVHGADCTASGSSCSIGTGSTANTALKTYLNNQIYPGINGANLTVSTTYAMAPGAGQCTTYPATTCNGPGDQVTVTVTYPYIYHVPFIPQRSFTMQGTSTMIISQ